MGKNLEFSWKMDCLHFLYTRQAKITKIAFILAEPFSLFFEVLFCRHFGNHTKSRKNWKSCQIWGVTLYLLKIRTFAEISKFYHISA